MKDALTRELDDLVTRRRQLVEMRVQESLRLGRASKVQQKSLKSHIAWLDKRQNDRRLEHVLPLSVKYLYMGVNLDSSNHVLPTTRLIRAIWRWCGANPDNAGPRDHAAVASRPKGVLKRIAAGVRSSVNLAVRLSEEWFRQSLAWYYRRRGNLVLFVR